MLSFGYILYWYVFLVCVRIHSQDTEIFLNLQEIRSMPALEKKKKKKPMNVWMDEPKWSYQEVYPIT